jgi:rhodanese-related sulfurtransferase
MRRMSTDVPLVDLTQLRALMAAGGVRLVEALGPDWFADAHLPGAVDLPSDRVDDLAPLLLPDRAAVLVVYCSDPSCPSSAVTARRLRALGWTDVRRFAGGKQEWIRAGLPVERDA